MLQSITLSSCNGTVKEHIIDVLNNIAVTVEDNNSVKVHDDFSVSLQSSCEIEETLTRLSTAIAEINCMDMIDGLEDCIDSDDVNDTSTLQLRIDFTGCVYYRLTPEMYIRYHNVYGLALNGYYGDDVNVIKNMAISLLKVHYQELIEVQLDSDYYPTKTDELIHNYESNNIVDEPLSIIGYIMSYQYSSLIEAMYKSTSEDNLTVEETIDLILEDKPSLEYRMRDEDELKDIILEKLYDEFESNGVSFQCHHFMRDISVNVLYELYDQISG